MSGAEIAAAVEAHVRAEGDVPDGDRHFDRDVDLFEFGYVDSVGFVELVVWLEETYDIKLTEAYLFDERFNTIAGIASIVDSRVREQMR
jgi:acyl carrier protein